MRKWIFGLTTLIILALAVVYFFIPANNMVLTQAKPAGSAGSVLRAIGFSSYRTKWLPPEGKQLSATEYELDDCKFIFPADNTFDNNIIIVYKNKTISSLITAEAVKDSALVNWIFTLQSNNNPINRVSDYRAAKKIKLATEKILKKWVAYAGNNKNIYGINIKRTAQTDSTLISIKSPPVNNYPSIEDIYGKISKLEQYALANDAVVTKPPMLNISGSGSSWFYMVALSVNKALPDNADIIAKRMFAGGKILESDSITGGFKTVDHFINELEKFRADNSYMSPAIPFQSLITNRLTQPDSTKWITKLYYPVY